MGKLWLNLKKRLLNINYYKYMNLLQIEKEWVWLLKNIQTDKIELYWKGANSKISPLMVKDKSIYLNYTLNELKKFEPKGLRTLLVT